MLYIHLLDPISGDDTPHAVFKKWDYFLIEEDL